MNAFRRRKSAQEIGQVIFRRRFDPEITWHDAELLFARIRGRVEILAGKQCSDDDRNRIVISLFENSQGTFPSLDEFERALKKAAVEHFS